MTRPGIAAFKTEAGRERFLTAYDTAMALWPEPRDELDVQTAFGSVHVHRYGVGTGEPIVLLHGHGSNASAWYPQVAPLGRHHPVYALDTLDDPGRSVQTRAITSSAENAAWINETLAGLGLDRVHLIGLSYGGWLTLNQAIYGPQRLASVTVLDPGGLQKVRAMFFLSMILGLPALAAPQSLRPWLARSLANWALIAPPELMAPVRLSALAFKPDRPAARPFTDEELQRITVPTLALLAARSTLLNPGRAQQRLHHLVPHAQTEIVAGVGHALPLEAPELINARVLGFLGEVQALG